MGPYQSIALFFAIVWQFYSIDARPRVVRNQREILESIQLDSFDRTAPTYPGQNLCNRPNDYKTIICREVIQLLGKYGQWDESRESSAQYQCHEAKIAFLQPLKSTFIFQCTDSYFNRTKDSREPDLLPPPFLNGIFIGESQTDRYRTYVYTKTATNEIVPIFSINQFCRDTHVGLMGIGSTITDMKMG